MAALGAALRGTGIGALEIMSHMSLPALLTGWDMGAGVMILFGDHIGVRGDIRKISSFQERTILGFTLSNQKLDFKRASAALVLAF